MRKIITLQAFNFFTFSPILLFSQINFQLQQYVAGLTSPVDIVHCGDERLFIVQRNGIIRIINANGSLLSKPFLDIDSLVRSSGGEQGLLGLAFHPQYKTNRFFFVNYIDNNGNTRVDRFQTCAVNADSAIAGSKQNVLSVQQPFNNHNGGDLAFGHDGYLYIPFGDGGSAGDPQNHAQDKNSLLGKILRLNVNALPYTVPPDNPFVNDTTTRDEIWALGLRNPWRFSFDKLIGDMWVADVGQGTREEVNFQPAGAKVAKTMAGAAMKAILFTTPAVANQ